MVTDAQLKAPEASASGHDAVSATVRYVGGTLALAAAYYAAGQASLALQYTGPVAAIWLPSGLAAAVLYLAGLRWWPGVLIADLALAESGQPPAAAFGLTAGNIADILVMALVMRRLLGPRAALDRLEQVGGMLMAIAAGAAVTATAAALSLRLAGIVGSPELPVFWRSWFLADAAGSLVVIPLLVAWWGHRPRAWHAVLSLEGAAVTAAVAALSIVAVSGDTPLYYMVFPPLIWAAVRLGQRGATLAVALAVLITVWSTAHEVGPYVRQSITEAVLQVQLYIAVAALTTLCLAAIVAERRRTALDLEASRLRERGRAADERQRIARDLHDSVSQSLFSSALHLRTAERELAREGVDVGGMELERAGQLLASAREEMRDLVVDPRPGAAAEDGLVLALSRHAAAIGLREQVAVVVRGPGERLPLRRQDEEQLYRLCQEALANVVKHADATRAEAGIEVRGGLVTILIRDDGRGFDTADGAAGGFGLRSMRTRAAELGGRLDISSAPGRGTVVRVEVPAT